MPSLFSDQDHYFMKRALREAEIAYEQDEVPVGCVVVIAEHIVGRGHNQVERLKDCTAHAEMIAITAACEKLGSKYINDATIYVTLEPCLMCAGAILWSRAHRLVFGCRDEKKGFLTAGKMQETLCQNMNIHSSLMNEECSQLLVSFFKSKRLRS